MWSCVRDVGEHYRKIGFAFVNREGVIEDCTVAFATLLEMDRTEIINTSINAISFPEDRASIASKLEALFTGVGHVSTIKRYRTPAGQSVFRRLESQVIVERDESRLYCISALHEVTKPHEEFLSLQEELNTLAKELEQIAGRTNITVTGADHSNKAGRDITTTSNQGWVMVAVLIAASAMVALAVRGSLTVTHEGNGKGTVEVNSEEE